MAAIEPKPDGNARRDDIDGLRAVAILLVMLFHAGVAFPGGFVGVDIFFVISGYLITGIIAAQLKAAEFSLLGFYRRRLLRIVPAAAVTIIACFVAGLFLLPPNEFRLFSNSALAAAFSVANIYFWGSAGYFDSASEWKPLLHLWTLSVEEQFYLLAPILLLITTRLSGWRFVRAIVLIAFLVSFGWSMWTVLTAPVASFFSLQSRAWELLLGAMLALGMLPKMQDTFRGAAGTAGAALILAAAVFFDQATPFPGAAALLPCVGAALLIWCGSDAPSVWSRILSMRPLPYLGRISFSLYLWHWPILVFGAVALDRKLTGGEGMMALGLSFIVSAISWRFVEQPFIRRVDSPSLDIRRNLGLKVAGAILLLGVAATLGLAGRIFDGIPARATTETLTADTATTDISKYASCFTQRSEVRGPAGCTSGGSLAYGVVVWGDSHGEHIFPAVAEAAGREGRSARLIAKSGCPPLMDVVTEFPQVEPEFAAECAEFVGKALDTLDAEPAGTTIVLASAWSGFKGRNMDGNRDGVLSTSLRNTVDRLRRNGHQVLVVRQLPGFPQDPPRCAARAGIVGRATEGCFRIPAAVAEAKLKESNAAIDAALADFPDVAVFDPIPIICDAVWCSAKIGGHILYRDEGHLSSEGSRWLGLRLVLPSSSDGGLLGNQLDALTAADQKP